jgi:hypothetical protein
VFTNSRLSGLSVETSRQNVVHAIEQTGVRVGRRGIAQHTPYRPTLPFDRSEFLRTLLRLDIFYKSWNGLQRPDGLSKDGQPDFRGIAAWVFGDYLNRRTSGSSPEESWDAMVSEIQRSDEWRLQKRRAVDSGTLTGKHLTGYQGWFCTPHDGQENNWDHWFRNGAPPAGDNLGIDLWPDTREYFDSELEATAMSMRDWTPARLYSCHNERTLRRHFEWMADYGLDGVSLGRFINGTKDEKTRKRFDGLLLKMRRAAEATGRVFFVWYDVSGCPGNTFVSDVQNDWSHIVRDLRVQESPSYLRHNGKPIVGLWAAGANTCYGSPNDWRSITAWLKSEPAPGASVLLSTMRDWRTDDVWRPVVEVADIVAPWAVTGCYDLTSADQFCRDVVAPDIAHARARGQEYLPIMFPGFSSMNQHAGAPNAPLNSTARLGGRFYWRQAHNVIQAGATCLFTAMFDEVDEGTAIYKVAATQQDTPSEGRFLSLDADGELLPSDWYLRLAGEAGKMVRREIQAQEAIPIRP